MSFVEGDAFRFVTYRDGKWSQPRTIGEREDLLVNRADYPSIAAAGKKMIATWSTRKEHGSVIRLARSEDGGATWTVPRIPHPEFVSQYAFVSLAPSGDVVWLDGRKLPGGMEGAGEMELRHDGTQHAIDGRVCDCCQTALAVTSAGPIVAYRDRSDEDIRDISIVRRTSNGWTEPKRVHADGWKLDGCPVNGPQIDAIGDRVAVAWFTAANGDPRVYVAYSEDAGATFAAPIRVATATKPAGRVDVAFLEDDGVYVTWLEQRGEKSILFARYIDEAGKQHEPIELGEANGFPRMAVSQENVGVVWAAGERVQFAIIR